MSEQTITDVPQEGQDVDEASEPEARQTLIARRTEKFRGQHNVLVYHAEDLYTRATSIETIEDAKAARKLLNHFAGKLVVHLAKEDKSLYPTLLKSSDPKVVALTKRFIREMGDLAETFEGYTKRWVNPQTILENNEDFAAETKSIVTALGQRIDRENNELYVLADELPED